MPDRYNYSDDPTEPARPAPQYPSPQGSGQNNNEKLVLGNFQNQPQAPQRRPYQYPPNQGGAGTPPYPYQQPVASPPMVYPDAGRYGRQQPGQMAGPSPRRKPRRRRGGCMIGCLTVLVLFLIIGGFTLTTAQRVWAFGSTISTQKNPISTQTNFMNTSERTNLLVMGYGGANHEGGNLTDSLVVVSLLPQSHHTSLVSVPRDLWVQNPPNSGHYTKINEVYVDASNGGAQPAAGGDAAAAKIGLVTGLDVKYWMTINFTGFRELIDSIGGIDVYVPDAFTTLYPKNDDPKVDASWIKVHFDKGNQHMNGETAIRYARAREVLDNPAEGTDFARSARQQIIIKAVLAKVKQSSTWPNMFNAMDALQHTIYTNMSFADLSQFALKMDMNDPKTARIGLSNQNVLVDSTSNSGQYILQPRNNDWPAIVDYVKQHLYN